MDQKQWFIRKYLRDCGDPDGHTGGSAGRFVWRGPHSDCATRGEHRFIAAAFLAVAGLAIVYAHQKFGKNSKAREWD